MESGKFAGFHCRTTRSRPPPQPLATRPPDAPQPLTPRGEETGGPPRTKGRPGPADATPDAKAPAPETAADGRKAPPAARRPPDEPRPAPRRSRKTPHPASGEALAITEAPPARAIRARRSQRPFRGPGPRPPPRRPDAEALTFRGLARPAKRSARGPGRTAFNPAGAARRGSLQCAAPAIRPRRDPGPRPWPAGRRSATETPGALGCGRTPRPWPRPARPRTPTGPPQFFPAGSLE